jgi:Raf kinase inhibitor-like YbhB/YbcL family protein
LAVMPLLVITDRSAAAKEIVAAENNAPAAVSFEHYRHVLRTRGTPAPTSQARKERTTPRKNSLLLIVLIMIFLPSCGRDPAPVQMEEAKGAKMTIEVTSSAFEDGDAIPARYTCEGLDVSPSLSWGSAIDGTRSLALIADDPDAPAGTFVHWVIYDLPPDTRGLPEDVPNQQTLPSGAAQGMNGAGSVGYMGPCPPGGTHRYFFKLYALDTELGLGGGATKDEVLDAMEGHILAEGQLMGTYRRR